MDRAVDMGASQRRLDKASTNRKSCKTKLSRAQEAMDNANKEYIEAEESFRTATQTVLNGTR